MAASSCFCDAIMSAPQPDQSTQAAARPRSKFSAQGRRVWHQTRVAPLPIQLAPSRRASLAVQIPQRSREDSGLIKYNHSHSSRRASLSTSGVAPQWKTTKARPPLSAVQGHRRRQALLTVQPCQCAYSSASHHATLISMMGVGTTSQFPEACATLALRSSPLPSVCIVHSATRAPASRPRCSSASWCSGVQPD